MAVRPGQVLIEPERLIGEQFGQLEVLSYLGSRYTGEPPHLRLRHDYQCKCSCGAVVTVRRDLLLNGHKLSCGCRPRGPLPQGAERKDWHNNSVTANFKKF